MDVITSLFKRSVSLRSMTLTIFPPYSEGFTSLLQSVPSLNTTLSINDHQWLGGYCPWGLWPTKHIETSGLKVLFSRRAHLFTKHFYQTSRLLEYTGKLYLRPGNYGDLYSLPPASVTLFIYLPSTFIAVSRIPKNMIRVSYFISLVERGVWVDVLSKQKKFCRLLLSSIGAWKSPCAGIGVITWTRIRCRICLDLCGVSQARYLINPQWAIVIVQYGDAEWPKKFSWPCSKVDGYWTAREGILKPTNHQLWAHSSAY